MSSRGEDGDDREQEGRGRSARKREVRAFDAMALELVALPAHRCAGLPVTEEMKASLRAARETRAKAARRRHLRHLAGLLRDSPPEVEAIKNFLAGAAYTVVSGDESYRDLEALRTGLCHPETFSPTLEEACQHLPHIDLALVTRLARSLHEGPNDKAYRALFKELRRAADESEEDAGDREI